MAREKKVTVACRRFHFPTGYSVTPPGSGTRFRQGAVLYVLSLQRMMQNDYPTPADAVDCEMACCHFSTMHPTQSDIVSDRRWQGTDPGLHH